MLVSIIIPTFNSEKFIEKCIKSILAQTYKNYEVIFIDNSSLDKTLNIIKKYELNFDNFKLEIVKNNKNIANSRNIGIIKSKGDYVAFLDSDDFWEPNKLEISMKFLKNNDFFYHDMNIIDFEKNKKINTQTRYQIDDLTDLLVKDNPIATSSVVIKKKILRKNLFSENLKYRTIEDFELWLRLIQLKVKIKYYDRKLGSLVERKNSSSTKEINKVHGFKLIYLKYLKNYGIYAQKKILTYYKFRVANIIYSLNPQRSKKFFIYVIMNENNLNLKIKSIIKIIKIILKKFKS